MSDKGPGVGAADGRPESGCLDFEEFPLRKEGADVVDDLDSAIDQISTRDRREEKNET